MTGALGGVIPILPTPFTPQGAIDDESFIQVIEAAIASGVDGLAMFGLASEYYKLSDAERFHLTELLIHQAAKRCPVVISIVPHATKLAVTEAVRASQIGADALMVLPPFFLGPSIDAIVHHIRSIAAAVAIPVIVQYAPIQTGRVIEAQVFAKLRDELANFSHVKVDLVPSGPMISSLHSCDMHSLVGYMGLHLPEDFSRGVGGVMPTASLAGTFVKIWRLLPRYGEQARQLHRSVLPLLNFMMQSIEFLIASEKELLVEGEILKFAYCREPSYCLDTVQKTELRAHVFHLQSWLRQNHPSSS